MSFFRPTKKIRRIALALVGFFLNPFGEEEEMEMFDGHRRRTHLENEVFLRRLRDRKIRQDYAISIG